jgi:multicomponent Na+:H+ antiporter subunit F
VFEDVLWGLLLALLAMVGLCLVRAALGPTVADRMIAINVIGTKSLVLIVGVSIAAKQPFFVDIALVYGLIGFLATIGVAAYMEQSGREPGATARQE